MKPNQVLRIRAVSAPAMTEYRVAVAKRRQVPLIRVKESMPPMVPPMTRGNAAIARPVPEESFSLRGTTAVVFTSIADACSACTFICSSWAAACAPCSPPACTAWVRASVLAASAFC